LYYEKWRVTAVPIVYVNDSQRPLVKWSDLYEKEAELISDEELWRRAHGVAVLPRGNHVVIDVDSYPDVDALANRLRKELVLVRTRRGLHIHAEVDRAVGELRIYRYGERIGEGGGALYKHLWTVPPTNRNGFIYKFVGYEEGVPDLPKWKWEDLKDYLELELNAEIEEVSAKPLSGKDISLNVCSISGIEQLSVEQLKILLFMLFHDVGCYGLRDLMYEWIKDGRIEMRKFGWGNRTSRFYFFHTVTATLALLGAPHRKVAELLETYEDADGKPDDSHKSALWTVYEWKQPLFRRLYVLKRGECFFCSIRGYRNCQKNPVMRVYYYLESRGRLRVEEMVRKLLERQSDG